MQDGKAFSGPARANGYGPHTCFKRLNRAGGRKAHNVNSINLKSKFIEKYYIIKILFYIIIPSFSNVTFDEILLL